MSGISLTFGGDPVFSDLDLVVQPGDRLHVQARVGDQRGQAPLALVGQLPDPLEAGAVDGAVAGTQHLQQPAAALAVGSGPGLCLPYRTGVRRVAGQRAAAADTALQATGPDAVGVLALMRTFA